jgi:hypothetical protein
MYSSPKIYPIRTNASSWKIFLYSKHICTNDCQIAVIEEVVDENTTAVFFIENPEYKDGKCSFYHKINQSMINLNNFNDETLQTSDGILVYDNQIVVPDNEIYVQISFPLKYTRKILIKNKNTLGFSLSELITYIKKLYRWIYEEEEKTCTSQTHSILYSCDCTTIPNSEKLKKSRDDKIIMEKTKEITCSICLDSEDTTLECKEHNDFENFSLNTPPNIDNETGTGTGTIAKTLCNHVFHTKCIDKWLEINKKCPLCREDLMKCELCEGKEVLCKEYIGKVIPRSMRSYRNNTDGFFGIYTYDFEDLYIENMFYNRTTKTLHPKIVYA